MNNAINEIKNTLEATNSRSALGKGNNQNFQRLSNPGFELTLISGKPKCHSGSPVRVGAYEDQAVNGVLARPLFLGCRQWFG